MYKLKLQPFNLHNGIKPSGYPWVDIEGTPWVDIEGFPWVDNNDP
jgi:hypothetical protein